MEGGFLSQKESGGGIGVKDKSLNNISMNTSSGIGVSMEFDDTMNEDTPVGVASTVNEGVTTSVVDMMVEKEKIYSLEDTTDPESFLTLTTLVINMAGNAPGKSLYANITSKPSGKKVNVRTLFTPGGNGIDVVVLVDSIRAISERFANTAYGFFLGKKVAYPVVANYVGNTYGKYGLVRSMFSSSSGLFSFQFSSMDGLYAMLKNVWVKLHGVPVTAFNEDDLSAIATKLVMIELRADVELKENIVVAMPKITRKGHYTYAGEKKTMKKPCQTSQGVSVGPKIGFKPHKEYRPVPKKSTAGSSGNKKKGEEPIIKWASFLVDKKGNPLKEIEFPGEDDSEDERDSYGNGDYDDDPYDDDMYEGHDLSHELQAICDNLDIRKSSNASNVPATKKKVGTSNVRAKTKKKVAEKSSHATQPSVNALK
ncbi:hypothetical protein Tco_1363953 [Tanacetum coccineum]